MTTTYLNFLKTLGKQDDQEMMQVIELIKNDTGFPNTADINKVAKHLYLKLNQEETLAFQKSLMLYFYVQNGFQQPDDPKVLDEINTIVNLQNNDPNYHREE